MLHMYVIYIYVLLCIFTYNIALRAGFLGSLVWLKPGIAPFHSSALNSKPWQVAEKSQKIVGVLGVP